MKSALFLLEEQVHLGTVTPSMVGAALAEQIGYLRGKAQHMSDTRILDTELDALVQIQTGIDALTAVAPVEKAASPDESITATIADSGEGTSGASSTETKPEDAAPVVKTKRPSRARKVPETK